MRVRSRRRLIGMVVLLGAGVIGFPWLFETQPRPMSGDIQIVQAPHAEVSTGAAVASHVGAGASIAAVTVPSSPTARVVATASEAGSSSHPREADLDREEFVSDAPSRPSSVASAVHVAGPQPAATKPMPPQPVAQPVAKPGKADPVDKKEKLAAKPTDKDKKPEKDKSAVRYVVQFGAFSDVNSAHEARMKAERLGLKTYAQQVDTPQGKRIRVRLGPFADKAEADKAAATLRKAALPGAVLIL
jgi:DedD protein